jgi:hypothetical protein
MSEFPEFILGIDRHEYLAASGAPEGAARRKGQKPVKLE